MASSKPKEGWNSRLGVVLAVAGSAVGLGNFLRFPGLAAQFGGGAFMLAYFISFLIIGLPICWAEWTIGRHGGQHGFNSSPGIFNLIWKHPAAKYIGIIGVIIPVVIYMYYVYIEAWCLGYAVNFLAGNMEFETAVQSSAWWNQFIGVAENGSAFTGLGIEQVGIYLLIGFILNFVLIYRGVSGGIELFCKYAVPTLVVLAIIILVRVLTLGAPNAQEPDENVANGLGFMWNPTKHFVSIGDPAHDNWLQIREVVDQERLAELTAAAETPATFRLETLPIPAAESKGKTPEEIASLVPPRALDAQFAPDGEWTRIMTYRGEAAAIVPDDEDESIAEHIEAILAATRGKPAVKVEHMGIFAQLANPDLWLAAAGQIFFSLSVGFGVIIVYSSYMRRNDDVVLSGLAATSTNELCEVCLGGIITVPAAVAFIGVAGLAGVGLGTFDLGFKVLPLVFSEMIFGNVFGFLWFLLLFLAAVTSSISMLQPGIAFLEETLQLDRKRSTALLGLITALGCGFIVFFSAGIKALDTLDFWVGTFLIFILATIQIILFGWIFGVKRGFEEAHIGAAIPIPGIFRFIMKYLSPVFLITIFVFWVLTSVLGINFSGGEANLSGYVVDLFVEPDLVAWLSVTLVTLLFIFFALIVSSVKRYKEVHENPQEDA